MRRSLGGEGGALRLASLIALAAFAFAASAGAQDGELEDVFGGLGTAGTLEEGETVGVREGEGTILGLVVDADTGGPIAGVTVLATWAGAAGPDAPERQIQVTDGAGEFEFPSLPGGTYNLSFVKSGYRASTMTNFAVTPGELARADFPMPPAATAATGGDVLDLDPFVVDVTTVNELMATLDYRLEQDQLLNIMSAEDLSRFAASDVADALKRVAGVNIVEGQFAIIRGLEDRYSSTLFNSAAVPSPDPTSQSVQLDLFPSDVVSNLVVSKTFGASTPGNSAGGSIDIVTTQYPEETELKLSVGSGFEDNALDRFLGLNDWSPTGKELDSDQVVETDINGTFGGRKELFDREVRFRLVGSWERDYRTAEGFQEGREPRQRKLPDDVGVPSIIPEQSGELSYGLLSLSEGRYDLLQSTFEEQQTGFGAIGIDLDEEGRHQIDLSVFYTTKSAETVQHKENAFIPGMNEPIRPDLPNSPSRYDQLVSDLDDGEFFQDPSVFANFATFSSWFTNNLNEDGARTDLPFFWYNFTEARSVEVERDLLLYQANGTHDFESVDGLSLTWAGNQANTNQTERGIRSRIFNNPFQALGDFPREFPVRAQGPSFVGNDQLIISETAIEENQDFFRMDAEYERTLRDWLGLVAHLGGWYERSKRSVDAVFLENSVVDPELCRTSPICNSTGNGGRANVFGGSLEDVGRNQIFAQNRLDDGTFAGNRPSENDSSREIWSINLDSKFTFWDDVDFVSGLRVESIRIQSDNQARAFFLQGINAGEPLIVAGTQDLFPSRYLFFDRQDNPDIGEIQRRPTDFPIFNDEILGIDVPVDPVTGIVDITDDLLDPIVQGDIDNTFLLPTLGLTWRAMEGLNLRGAWSRTVARPSFRELGYYVTIPVGSSGLEVGNPQLGLSKVESVDGRVEYTWGDQGDLVAFSAFYKTIQDPIEQIVLRDPSNNDRTSLALYRTWFNNPNTAKLWGIETEFRKNLGFLSGEIFGFEMPDIELFEYFSVGANFTYIDAEVKRTEAQRLRAERFFGTLPGDPPPRFTSLSKKRRLFGQPEWIANADIGFDHPDWGTKITLALFAISDVLDAAGSAGIGPNGAVDSFVIDSYIDSFHQLDLVFSQQLIGGLRFKASIKNLTDSYRGIKYDAEATSFTYRERRFRIGRDYSFAFTYTQEF